MEIWSFTSKPLLFRGFCLLEDFNHFGRYAMEGFWDGDMTSDCPTPEWWFRKPAPEHYVGLESCGFGDSSG